MTAGLVCSFFVQRMRAGKVVNPVSKLGVGSMQHISLAKDQGARDYCRTTVFIWYLDIKSTVVHTSCDIRRRSGFALEYDAGHRCPSLAISTGYFTKRRKLKDENESPPLHITPPMVWTLMQKKSNQSYYVADVWVTTYCGVPVNTAYEKGCPQGHRRAMDGSRGRSTRTRTEEEI